MTNLKIQPTEDGSFTLFSEHFGETYHSRHGALSETNHVFIREGLLFQAEKMKNIRVGEIGLGSRLNAWATCLATIENGISVDYFAIEPFPPPIQLLSDFTPNSDLEGKELFLKILETNENQIFEYSAFRFQWKRDFWPETQFLHNLDVIYYDAFAPGTQPELWREEAFSKAWNCLNPGGILVTYCAKGSVKRALKSVGFQVENPAGPKGKREMTRAIKI